MKVNRSIRRTRQQARVGCALAALLLAGCASTSGAPQTSQPDPKPDTWILDFDYQTRLPPYLRRQYALAREEGKTAYVYVYSDHPHCRMTRELASGPIVGPAYAGTRIVMLDARRVQWQLGNSSSRHGGSGLWTPIIMRIRPNGGLDAGAVLLPDLYQFHPELVSDPPMHHFSLAHNWVPMREDIAERIRTFFDRHDRNAEAPGAD